MRLLIVEDNAILARALAMVLEAYHLEIDRASQGSSALTRYEERPPDAVLMDMSLPDMSGFELAAELRRRGCAGLLIAMTGLTGEEARRRALQAGCDVFFEKPVEIEQLLGALGIASGAPRAAAS